MAKIHDIYNVYDVAVIGAGVVGSLIARELTKYNLKVALIEKESDVAMGTSKGNSAIVHAGFDANPGSLKAELNVRGCDIMRSVCEDLGVHYKQKSSLVCSFEDTETEHLKELKRRGKENGVPALEIISGDRLFNSEPNLSREIKAALCAPTAGIVCPYFLAIAAAENAVLNNCDLMLSFEVAEVISDSEILKIISKNKLEINTRYIINAAGLYADEIAVICGDGEYVKDKNCGIIPRKGEYMLMDKNAGSLVNSTVFSVPSDKGKGILVSPTVDGNLVIGPNAVETEKDDSSTTFAGLDEITRGAQRLVPALNMRQVITSFAGVRATPKNHDFNIFPSENKKARNILHLIGIESPGLASSPAIAEYVVGMIRDMGLKLVEKINFNPKIIRRKQFSDMTDIERAEAIKENKLYAKIICRCETVTEAEIINFINGLIPATTVDAVKRRTRAGMGRCQGGFCLPRVVEILARESGELKNHGVDMLNVTKKGGRSYILTGKTKTNQ